jgi:glycosyltransferase involved in cell wall biosynthesis
MNSGSGVIMDGGFMLAIIVPITKLSQNSRTLETWLSVIPQGKIEVILVHDIQDNATAIELTRILEKVNDPRIKLYEGIFGGPGLTRNMGLQFATSKWLWFVDADDLPEIQNALDELDKVETETEVLVGRFQIDISGRKTVKRTSRNDPLKDVARNPGIWRMLFKAESFLQTRFQEFKMAEDQIFLLDAGFFNRNCEFSDKIFYTYFKHDKGQLTSQKKAIKDLSKTIPLVIGKIFESEPKSLKYLKIMLARQLVTQLRHSSGSELNLNLKNFYTLSKNLTPRSKVAIALELCKVPLFKLVGVMNV